MLGHEPVTSALGRLEQDFQYFKGSQSYIMSSELAGARMRPAPKRKRREREEDRRGGSKRKGKEEGLEGVREKSEEFSKFSKVCYFLYHYL